MAWSVVAIWVLQAYISIHNTIHLASANTPMPGKILTVILPLTASG